MGQNASVKNFTNETIKAAVTTNLSATVNASANANCQNIQRVEGLRCCKIEFSEQTCEATAINEVIAAGRLDATVTQGIASAVQQAGQASTEGLAGAIYSGSNVNNVSRRNVDIAVNTTQTFETDCSKNATGLNEQSVKSAYCGCPEDGEAPSQRGVDIKFAPQTITLEAVGTCVSDIVGTSAAAQDYSSFTGQTAKASVTGVNLLELFLAMIGPLMIFIIAPVGFKIATTPSKKQEQRMTPEETAAKTGIRVGQYSFQVLILFTLLWWPGLAAWFLGAPPFFEPEPILDNRLCNPEGGTRQLDLIVNRFQWYDPQCASKPPGETCTEEEKYKAYDTCGIFSKAEICKDPQFQQDKPGFRQMQKLCGDISGFTQNGLTTGTVPEIASVVMKANRNNPYGRGCKLCFSNEPGLVEKNGLYKSIDLEKLNDPDNEECKYTGDPNDPLPDSCYLSCDLIDPLAYVATAVDANNNTIPCDPTESAFCYSDVQAYESVSPNECTVPAYQEAKKKLSEAFRKIEAAETAHRTKFATAEDPLDGKIRLSEMCEPNVFDWMDCNPDFSCNYTASDPNDEFEVKACANDFEGCTDVSYLLDKEKQDIVEDDCKAKLDEEKSRDNFLKLIPPFTIGFYIFLILVSIVASIYGSRLSTQVAMNKNSAFGNNPVVNNMTGFEKGYAVVGQSTFFQFVFPFLCLLGIGAGVAFILVDELNSLIGYILCGVFGLGLIAGLAFILKSISWSRDPTNQLRVLAYKR